MFPGAWRLVGVSQLLSGVRALSGYSRAMSIGYPVSPEVDPNKIEESPAPDDDNNEDEHGIADTDRGAGSSGG